VVRGRGSTHVEAKRLSRKSIQFIYMTLDKGFTNSNTFRVVKVKKTFWSACNKLISGLNGSDCQWLLIDFYFYFELFFEKKGKSVPRGYNLSQSKINI